MPENYQAPFDFIQPTIEEAAELDTDSERVEYLNDYLCTLLAYKKGKTAGVTRTFAQHSGELQAACGSYARAFKFLCGAAGIPCFTISTSNHTWNTRKRACRGCLGSTKVFPMASISCSVTMATASPARDLQGRILGSRNLR